MQNASLFSSLYRADFRAMLCRNWWAVALRGICGMLFGFLAFFWPAATLFALVALVAAYFAVDGVFAIVAGIRAAQSGRRYWPFILEGLLGVGIALLIFFWPNLSILAFMYLLAIWAILTGAVVMMGGMAIGTGMPRWYMYLAGALSIFLGVVMIAEPELGLYALAWWLGGYAFFFGALLLGLGLWLRHERSSYPFSPHIRAL